MSQQLTFADSEFSSKRRQTRKEIFLSRMDKLLPWPQLLEVIEPFYPKAGNGRRPYALETMFRIHCMQQWYSLGDEAMEDALYEIASMREERQGADVEWLIAERPVKVRALKKHLRKNKKAINIEYLKASIRAKVEHPFRIIKCQFGFIKARYKGLVQKRQIIGYVIHSGERV